MSVLVENILITIVLGILAVEDIKRKSFSIKWLGVLGVLATIFCIIKWNNIWFGVEELFSSGLVGVGMVFVGFLLIMSFGVKAIGLGDVILLLIMLMIKGVVFVICTFLGAVTLVAVVSIFLLMLKKIGRKDTIAFVPFILVAAVGVMLCG